jgi:flagellar biogenesis protein FliO
MFPIHKSRILSICIVKVKNTSQIIGIYSTNTLYFLHQTPCSNRLIHFKPQKRGRAKKKGRGHLFYRKLVKQVSGLFKGSQWLERGREYIYIVFKHCNNLLLTH